MSNVEWLGPRPEERRLTRDYCKQCGIARGVDVLNYRGPCRHDWEVVVFVPRTDPSHPTVEAAIRTALDTMGLKEDRRLNRNLDSERRFVTPWKPVEGEQ